MFISQQFASLFFQFISVFRFLPGEEMNKKVDSNPVLYFPTTSLLLKVLRDIAVTGSAVYTTLHPLFILLVFSQHPLAFETFLKKRNPPAMSDLCTGLHSKGPISANVSLSRTRTAFGGSYSPTTQEEARWPCRCQLADDSSSGT